ncbi:sugar phosphate nucleotidyltransferase [Gloeobacter kilaueensis]|uniref:Nucleotidyl transferase n=1 Tax=Gloeobacter kilaueensis (strain ATCC BAA-2537 / CCAP 1431/1 / ULC 316 / JS1) TaxID=1183438 RepID=U5QI35_GLOK1|nr:NDP-sugar synthase [Gloeobacter kilaueensis]AGY58647.1 nucleotidyl transferase [Gloeobacter kilaueensis JS1]
MKAFVLAAGKGTRLRPFTDELPKPLVPVLNEPVMARVMSLCHRHGFSELVANVHYKAERIIEAFGDGSRHGVSLRYSHEEKLLGTAGGVRRQGDYLADGTFAVVSGDVVSDLDLSELLAFHRERGALVTMAIKEVADPSRFGVVVTDPTGRITSFQEKPAPGSERSRFANMGIYILEPEVLDWIPAEHAYDFGSDLFPALLAAGAPLFAMQTDAYWSDVGTLPQYLITHWELLRRHHAGRRIGRHTIVEPGASIAAEAFIGDHCHVRAGAIVTGFSCIGDHTVLEAGAHVRDSVIWSPTQTPHRVSGSLACAIVGLNRCVEVEVADWNHTHPAAQRA